MKYKHLSQKDRETIFELKDRKLSVCEIARLSGRNKSTISREIKRNSTSIDTRLNNSPKKKKHYLPDRAHSKYRTRRRHSKVTYPLKNPFIYSYVLEHLKIGWSPEIISGRIMLDHKQKISYESIYKYIYGEMAKQKGYKFWLYLTQRRKTRRKKFGRKTIRATIKDRIDISQRPAIVDSRKRVGDWEGDTIFGKGKGAALATFNERKNRIIRIRKIKQKTAEEMEVASYKVFKQIPKEFRLTLTLDNGTENSCHANIKADTGLVIYFARPYHSWERGSNERANGLIRRYFPKGTNFDNITEEKIQEVEDFINNRPMKCLRWQSPNEKYTKDIKKLFTTKKRCT